MAKILNIEIDTAQLRVAETDSRGLRIYRCFTLPVPQGAVDDGQIRDTKTLGTLLKKELEARNINNKKVFFCNFAGMGYGCNPKYIEEETNKENLGFDMVWMSMI